LTNKEIIGRIRKFLDREKESGKKLTRYLAKPDFKKNFSDFKISVELEKNKDIILQEDTKLELGGINRKSFSLTYPLEELDLIENRKITLLGPEINEITDMNVDFGIFILIGKETVLEEDYTNFKILNFISNGIEGFLIRTIPRRFWCRISTGLINNNFSFEFLGNAIIYLYEQRFKDTIKSIELILINSYPNSIEQFIELSSEISNKFKEKWKNKIEEWKKRVDCEYDWGCEICPYQEECYNVKELLMKRNEIEY